MEARLLIVAAAIVPVVPELRLWKWALLSIWAGGTLLTRDMARSLRILAASSRASHMVAMYMKWTVESNTYCAALASRLGIPRPPMVLPEHADQYWALHVVLP